jgi:N-acetylglucosamine-6-sulfatase
VGLGRMIKDGRPWVTLPLLLVGGVALLVSSVACSKQEVERSAAPDDRLNVVFLFTDDQTVWSWRKKMPFLSSRPHGQWTTFRDAFISTPLCCPSRATVLTGQYSRRTGVITNDGRPFDDSQTLAVWLKAAGYRNGFVGKYLNKVLTEEEKGTRYVPPGWDDWTAMLEKYGYFNYQMNDNGEIQTFGERPRDYLTDVINRKALRFIKEQRAGVPFFLHVSYRSPHKPTIPAPRHARLYSHLRPRLGESFNEANVRDKPRWVRRLKLQDRRHIRRMYRREARTILSVDESTRDIIQELRNQDLLDRTVIVFMTDNGYARGHHRHHSKQCVYEECIRTPLTIRYPGARHRSLGHLVSNIDIVPTILDIAGAPATLEQDGKSLLPLIRGDAPSWRRALLFDYASGGSKVTPYWAVRTKRWKYAELSTGERELYRLSRDPSEMRNLAGKPRFRERQRRLAARLQGLKSWYQE